MTSNSSSTLILAHEVPRLSRSSAVRDSEEEAQGKKEATSLEVFLDKEEDPLFQSSFRKWLVVAVICSSGLCVACCSTIASFTEASVAAEFHVSKTVSILAISLFVEGLGCGPLLVGPLSEVYGRNIIYRVSFTLLFAFSFAVTFAPNIAVFLVFRFITGLCGSSFLSVAGGSISDMFDDAHVAMPMAIYTLSPFCGPVVGPLIGGFINQHLYWRWSYRIMNIWVFVQLVVLILFIPETYVPVLRKWKAERLCRTSGHTGYHAPLHHKGTNLMTDIIFSCCTPFKLLFFDRMVLLLDVWNAFLLGILYLAFQIFPVIFGRVHGFNPQSTGMTFLGMGLGMVATLAFEPYLDRRYKRISLEHSGNPPPEVRLQGCKIGAVLVPISLFWLAFTTYPQVPWPVPIIASIPFGTGIIMVYISTFTYLVTAYRPIAASALASNSALRSTFAAVFPLFSAAMYDRLDIVGATALLAGLALVMAPLPFIFERIGARLREKSPFAV